MQILHDSPSDSAQAEMRQMNPIKGMLKKAFPTKALQYSAWKTLIRDPKSYLYTSGWMESLREHKPTDSRGNPVPWMNFSVVRLLDERLTPDLSLFEFGSGYSTSFYASRVRSVTSVEYDGQWFSKVEAGAPPNLRLILQPKDVDGAYCRSVTATGELYDVIVVDGRDRVNCIKQGLPMLTPRGVMLLDDSERERYAEGLRYVAEKKFRVLSVEGMKGTDAGSVRTSIFYRDGNCLGL